MTDPLPPPLVPPDVDLRDFPFMPVDIGRLFGSEFHARSDDGAWRAGVTLFLKSYHQAPAASLPDDDIALARLAELGRDLKTWRKIKAAAMRGWIKCSDGRLYHKVVAEKALEGWIEKLGQRKSSAAGNAKRYGQTFDPTAADAAIDDAIKRLAALNPSSRLLAKHASKTSRAAPVGSAKTLPTGVPSPSRQESRPAPDGSPDHLPSGSQGTGKGQGQRREGKESSSSSVSAVAARDDDDDFFAKLKQAANGNIDPGCVDPGPLIRLCDEPGVDFEADVLAFIAVKVARSPKRLTHFGHAWLLDGIRKHAKRRLAEAARPATSAGGPPAARKIFIATDDPRWPQAEANYRRIHRKGPPRDSKNPRQGGESGWSFEPELLPAAPAAPSEAAG